jgi:hypothetical protein
MDLEPEEIAPRTAGIDPLLERQMEAQAVRQSSQLPSPIFNFQGHAFNGVTPPDPVGDVGEGHYIQMTNHPSGSIFTIYDKHDGSVVAGPHFFLPNPMDARLAQEAELSGIAGRVIRTFGEPRSGPDISGRARGAFSKLQLVSAGR